MSKLSRDQEIWGIALWVERQHGENGWFHVAQQQDRLLELGDLDGIAMWRDVAKRMQQLGSSEQSAARH
ncbi:MAG: hypothetical protein P1U62_14900 [Alteraurantiacibacter sp. bin_em_oilr2.035]|nr:hypothetical protein [Alteraurantiacibacter sp. bin_em_oilr2.035]